MLWVAKIISVTVTAKLGHKICTIIFGIMVVRLCYKIL